MYQGSSDSDWLAGRCDVTTLPRGMDNGQADAEFTGNKCKYFSLNWPISSEMSHDSVIHIRIEAIEVIEAIETAIHMHISTHDHSFSYTLQVQAS